MSSFDYPAAIAAARSRWRDPAYYAPLDPWGEFLRGMGGSVTAQNGEDGLIAAVLERIGVRNRWCFEVGASDGRQCSNTWALRQAGWTAVLIEDDLDRFRRLQANCQGQPGHLFNDRLTPEHFDYFLGLTGAPLDLDLGVIDIDGEDVAVWRGLKRFRPRVVLIEFNPSGDCIQGGTTQWQAGLETVVALAREKNYLPVWRTYCNVLAVAEEAIPA